MKNQYVWLGVLIVIILLIGGAALYKTQDNQSLLQAGLAGIMGSTATSTMATSTMATTSGSAAVHKTTTTTTVTTTVHSTVGVPGTVGIAPKITKFEPAASAVGSQVTIVGTGFSRTSNAIFFGTTGDRHHSDGTPDNQIATIASPDGTTLTFTVPASGPSGILCDSQNHCVGVTATRTTPGQYTVSVRTANGTSNTALLSIVAE